MSIYSIRQRWGMGPKIDPHFDARVGRIAALLESGATEEAAASGYIELDGEHPWDYLQALLAALYDAPSSPVRRRPLAWAAIREIRYLTTDPDTGIALPMHGFVPLPAGKARPEDRQAALEAAIERLRKATDDRLRQARLIGLTVVYDLEIVARRLLPLFNAERLLRRRDGGRQWANEILQRMLFGGGAGVRPFGAQKLGLAGSFNPQLAHAMRLLQTPPAAAAAAPLDYGILQTGRNTIVGIVDFGCDFAHPGFRTGHLGKGSRILALWDQNPGPGTPPVVSVGGVNFGFGYGRLFTRQAIETVLAQWQTTDPTDSEAPYANLQYDPHHNHYTATPPGSPGGPPGAHGTFVMEVAAGGRRRVGPAAGTDPATQPCGVAPDADIVFVQVRLHVLPDGRRELHLDDVIDAVAYVFHVAEQHQRPSVVNLSLNTMSGSHDGDGWFDRRLAALLRSNGAGPEARGRAVVIAAGNIPDNSVRTVRWQHLTDTVAVAAAVTFHWRLAARDPTRNIVEIWYDATDAWLQVTLLSPDGQALGPVKPGEVAELMAGAGWQGSVIGSRLAPEPDAGGAPAPEATGSVDEAAGRHVIVLQLAALSATPVQWHVLLEVAPDTTPLPAAATRVRFDAWLERDDNGPSGLSRRHPPAQAIDTQDLPCTVGTLSCGPDAIVVGGYSTALGHLGGWGLSGHGPSRCGDVFKPDLAAPGHFVSLVRSRRGNGQPQTLASVHGTSVAAPFVTGTIACVYEVDPRASLAAVRQALVQTALALPAQAAPSPCAPPLPGQPAQWSCDLGYGRLNPAGVLARFP